MDYSALAIICVAIVIAGWLWLAYSLGKRLGQQEQMLDDLQRLNIENQKEIQKKKKEMTDSLAEYAAIYKRCCTAKSEEDVK